MESVESRAEQSRAANGKHATRKSNMAFCEISQARGAQKSRCPPCRDEGLRAGRQGSRSMPAAGREICQLVPRTSIINGRRYSAAGFMWRWTVRAMMMMLMMMFFSGDESSFPRSRVAYRPEAQPVSQARRWGVADCVLYIRACESAVWNEIAALGSHAAAFLIHTGGPERAVWRTLA